MTDGFTADIPQIQAHAEKIDAARRRLAAVQAAATTINQDHAAYGRLCGWISTILQTRQVRQSELIAYVEENLRLAADALHRTGQAYAEVDSAAADRIRRAGQV